MTTEPGSGVSAEAGRGVSAEAGRGAVAASCRAARSSVPPAHLDAAGCNVPSDRVLDAVIDHLRLERERGGYAAVPSFATPKAALAALVGPAPPTDRAATARAGVGDAPDAAWEGTGDATDAVRPYAGDATDAVPPGAGGTADVGRPGAGDVAFLGSGTAAMAALLGGWRLPRGARVGFTRSEYASTLMLLHRLAARNGWTLVDLPADDHGRLDLDALAAALASGLDLVTLPHVASHRGVVQPAAEIGRLCREAGTPLVLDVCQSLGHVDVTGIGAIAYVGTSRKWLAGPRGVGFLIVPAPTPDMDAATPTLASHKWTSTPPVLDPAHPGGSERGPFLGEPGRHEGGLSRREASPCEGGLSRREASPREGGLLRGEAGGSAGWVLGVEPKAGAGRYEGGEAAVAAWVGCGVAVMEHHALGPAAVYAHLAELGEAARHALDGRGGWRVVEPFGEPSAIVTLRPPEGADAASLAARAAEEGVVVGVVPVARAPLDLREPVLRVSPPPGTGPETLEALARLLEKG